MDCRNLIEITVILDLYARIFWFHEFTKGGRYMSNHNASPQMLGYLFQVRCALALLLVDENEKASLCLEKFDDIAFSNDNVSPHVLIQTKHHVTNRGDLTNASDDLWRTLKVWIDHSAKHDISDIRFVIITTSNAPNGSASSLLRYDNRDVEGAYQLLKNVAETSKNNANAGYYSAFLQLSEDKMLGILRNTTVIDAFVNIENVTNTIKKVLRYATRINFEDRVLERIEGWWFEQSIKALSASQPVFIAQGQVRSRIREVSEEYSPDNLPIDIDFADDISINDLPDRERVFCEQLKLIAVKENRLKVAIRNYYRAFSQRNKWIKDELLYIVELEEYERKLVEEWESLFARMQDEVPENADEMVKQRAGMALYGTVEDKDIRIRPQCSEPFVMRGSYHILANRLKVGWHIDFINRLELILSREG